MNRHQHINKAISEHLTTVLLERGATKQGTARRAGIAPTTFRRCLSGQRAISVYELWRVSQALDVQVGALLPPKPVLDTAIGKQWAADFERWDGDDA